MNLSPGSLLILERLYLFKQLHMEGMPDCLSDAHQCSLDGILGKTSSVLFKFLLQANTNTYKQQIHPCPSGSRWNADETFRPVLY